MKKLIAAVCLAVGTQSHAITLSQLEYLSADEQTIYLAGIAETLMLSHGHNNVVGNKKLICFPDGVKAGANLARAALSTSAYDKNDRVALAVIKGMKEMFPCK